MSAQQFFPLLDISSQQLETFQKEILIPRPHVLSQLQNEAKFDHIQQKIIKNNNLLRILDHKDDCFRSYILTGENLPLIVLLKPRLSDSEKSEKNAITHQQMIHFVENVNIEIFFKKRDKESAQTQLLPSQSPYFYSNSYIETPRISQREIESLYIMNKISTIHSYGYDEETQALLLLIFIPIHLPSDQVNEKLFIDIELKCESQMGQLKQMQEHFQKSEEKFIDFLSKERDIFYKPLAYETKLQKNIILVNPFIISYDDHQLGDLNYIQISSNNEKIKIYPFCEYTFVLLLEKQQNKETQDLQNVKFQIKCEQCKQSSQIKNSNSNPSTKKNSLILLQPVVKQVSNNSLVRKMSNKSIDDTSQASGHSLKSAQNSQIKGQGEIRLLSKSQSAAQFNSSSLKNSALGLSPRNSQISVSAERPPIINKIKKMFSSQIRTDSNAIQEFDEHEENEIIQNPFDCNCQVLMNVSLNLNNSTPLIIRWTHEFTFQKIYTISQYKIIWSHKGSDILLVKLHRRKDHTLQVNSFYHLKMTVKNLTNRPLDLNCKLPVKISSKQNANDVDSKVVAICKESILDLGLVNPDEEVQTSFDYYLLSEGSFRINHIVFFDKINQKDIKVDINIFELVK